MASKDLLKYGCVVRIGSGDNIGIWDSPWLLDNQNPYVETALPGALGDATVSSFMNLNQSCWDEDLVCDIFS